MKQKSTQLVTFLLFTLIGVSFSTNAQITTPDSVCAGTQDKVYGISSANANSTFTWYIDAAAGGTIDNSVTTSNNEIEIDWGMTPGTYTVYAVETTEFGCIGDSVQLTVIVNDLPSATVVSDSVCEGFDPTLTFAVTGEFPVTIDFTDGTNNYSTVATASPHVYTMTGAGYTTSQTLDITSVVDDNTCSEVTPVTGINVIIHPAANTGQIYHY
ncbi:hypothetical protein Oweho_1424 [Owenweeksia hongkongensis DSM 17368]|uniref:Ig-like domain-containing protein n=1 Tax=Owenweeksia hongkongensis (strain DSM 17368 / CIP 108786 / JCM 12287 / NRRL B-23963 / UST20020801) TaxID=926562 RepID=G8R852_OWEHD|nr:hypothetical protein [Owenweeksia hongkongensis]AEV32420.1 hypothetical protein Oweho_1424 [Owenweeksia hongkongensis DSM 17368]